jgi:hypothetical protein
MSYTNMHARPNILLYIRTGISLLFLRNILLCPRVAEKKTYNKGTSQESERKGVQVAGRLRMFQVLDNVNLIRPMPLPCFLGGKKNTNNSRTEERKRAVAVSYLSVHPFLGRRRVGCSHWEVDPLDVRLDPQYLLHEYCSNTKEPKKQQIQVSRHNASIRQTENKNMPDLFLKKKKKKQMVVN